jgi:hypothetical protein
VSQASTHEKIPFASPFASGSQQGNSIWWTLDLLRPRAVSYVLLTGAFDSTVSATVNAWRNNRIFLHAGLSADWSQCFQFFANMDLNGAVAARFNLGSTVRFIHLRKPASLASANPTQAMAENTLQVKAVQVWGTT